MAWHVMRECVGRHRIGGRADETGSLSLRTNRNSIVYVFVFFRILENSSKVFSEFIESFFQNFESFFQSSGVGPNGKY